MDTQTVFTIIEMLDASIENVLKQIELDDPRGSEVEWYWGKRDSYTQFRDHLQDYIENQVAHMETEQGM